MTHNHPPMGMWQNYFRIGIPKQMKYSNDKTWILSKILRFSWQQRTQNIKLFKYYTEKDKNKI